MSRPDYIPENLSDEDVESLRFCGFIRDDGTFDVALACLEIADYRAMRREVSLVYTRLAGVSKPNTVAHEVIRLAEEREQEECDSAIAEATQDLREEVIGAVEALLSFQSGAPNFEAKKIYDGWRLDMDRLLRLRANSGFYKLLEHIAHSRSGSAGRGAALYGLLYRFLKGEPRDPSLDGWV